jgi:hypothetical protein
MARARYGLVRHIPCDDQEAIAGKHLRGKGELTHHQHTSASPSFWILKHDFFLPSLSDESSITRLLDIAWLRSGP